MDIQSKINSFKESKYFRLVNTIFTKEYLKERETRIKQEEQREIRIQELAKERFKNRTVGCLSSDLWRK